MGGAEGQTLLHTAAVGGDEAAQIAEVGDTVHLEEAGVTVGGGEGEGGGGLAVCGDAPVVPLADLQVVDLGLAALYGQNTDGSGEIEGLRQGDGVGHALLSLPLENRGGGQGQQGQQKGCDAGGGAHRCESFR